MNNEHGIYDSKEFKRSRGAYVMECTFEYFAALLVSDVYLSSLLSAVGMSDSVVGIVSSIISLAFVFQLFSMFLVQRITNTKKVASLFHFAGRMFFMTLYFIPFFPFAEKYRSLLAVVCIIFGYMGNYLVTSIIYKWGNSFVHPTRRARYSATKEMISLICGMVFTLVIGQIIDRFNGAGNKEGGFIFLGVTVLIATLCDLACLMMIKNEVKPHEQVEIEPIRNVIGDLAKNKSFVNLVILECMHKCAMYMTTGFLGTFKTKELLISIGTVQIINMVANLARFALSRPLGAFSDKTSYVSGITLGIVFKVISYIFVMFTMPGTWWLIIGYQILANVSVGATSQNFMNSVYSYVDKDHFVQAMAIKNSVSGVVGFCASLLGSAILGAIQSNGISLFGMPIYGQQVLAAISCLLSVCALLFAQFVVKKQKVMIQ